MLHTTIAPMRTTVGVALPIAKFQVIARSPDAAELEIDFHVHAGLQGIAKESYADFFPSRLFVGESERRSEAHDSVSICPLPLEADLPFGPEAAPLSIHGLLPPEVKTESRRLWVDIELTLAARARVGGICYGGHPNLPYYLADGEHSSNFGLPRELRVGWQRHETPFPDDDDVLTDQSPAAHSGIQYLSFGPVMTDRLVLRCADLPRFITDIDYPKERSTSGTGALVQCRAVPRERYGLLMPFLYVYSYREAARHRSRVSLGLVAATQHPPAFTRSYASPLVRCPGKPRVEPDGGDAKEVLLPADTVETIRDEFVVRTAASVLGQRRTYGTRARAVDELFCSAPLARDGRLTFVLAQAEDQPRCVAAINITFRASEGRNPEPRPALRMRIYSVDPVEGMSPLDVGFDPASSRYCTCLYDDVVPIAKSECSCRFVRPTTSEMLIIEMTNVSDRPGPVCIWEMRALRSAHVWITPRAARTQHVRALHYRVIGAGLADDYSCIGSSGFSFAVDLLTAGHRRQRLFAASSLLEMLDRGGARLYANNRRLEPEIDVSSDHTRTHAGGHETHTSRNRSTNWQRSETGEGVTWDDADPQLTPPAGYGFQSFGSSENRAQTEHVGHEGAGVVAGQFADMVNTIANRDVIVIGDDQDPLADPRLLAETRTNPAVPWTIAWKGTPGVTYIDAVSHLSIPPFLAFDPAQGVETMGKAIKDIMGLVKDGTIPTGPSFNEMMTLLSAIPYWFLVNGLGIGGSIAIQAVGGASVSFSGGQLLPSLSYSSTQGLSGAITLQATQSGYTYAQNKGIAGDISSGRTDFGEGSVTRTTTRTLDLPGSKKKRTKGEEIVWQDRAVDIITGSLPLSLTFPAIADDRYDTTDQILRVQLGEGLDNESIEFDVWFEIDEELIRRDY